MFFILYFTSKIQEVSKIDLKIHLGYHENIPKTLKGDEAVPPPCYLFLFQGNSLCQGPQSL